ncbi:helix-turn-helix domain-containing protein [Andreprevotia chitinilytica]|uniref:helix-turn-helix domain-containing protein n=1 Tax=Andreprevotia chitinilytica TaxID=396808 RepID=UPI0005509D7B|nr:helix-turn-helix domain-containing protein [Andreprevotia chitinilytica]
MQSHPSPSTSLSPAQAGAIIGVSEATLATWRCRGNGPAYLKRSGKVFYRYADVAAFAAARTTQHEVAR